MGSRGRNTHGFGRLHGGSLAAGKNTAKSFPFSARGKPKRGEEKATRTKLKWERRKKRKKEQLFPLKAPPFFSFTPTTISQSINHLISHAPLRLISGKTRARDRERGGCSDICVERSGWEWKIGSWQEL